MTMKKLLVFLLLCSTLIAMVFPAGAIAAENADPILSSDVTYDLVFDPTAVEIKESGESADLFLSDRGDTRHAVEDNLVFTGPYTRQYSITPNQTNTFHVGIRSTGKTNQYRVLLVYEGKKPEGEPVLTDIAPFPAEVKGLYTEHIDVYTKDFKPGRYTLVTCTAVPKGSTLYPIDGTAFMTDIYCYESYQRLWNIFIEDAETHEKMDIVRLCADESLVVAFGRSPLPCSNSGYISVTCPQDLVNIETAGGYIFLTPKRIGYGSLILIHSSDKVQEIPIYVCTEPGGHNPDLTNVALAPTVTEKGLSSNICLSCGSLYREAIPSLETSFGKFRDVPQTAWYYSAVQEAFYAGLFNGISETAFKPNDPMTRAMLVTVLWRAEGSPEGAKVQFSDVKSTDWYAEAVNWAAEQGIVNGVGNGKFNPTGKITREQMAAILYRYSQMAGIPAEAEDMVSNFPDSDQVSSWAMDAMNWNIHYGMIGGVKVGSNLYLDPKGQATRAQVSAILVRFINAFAEPSPQIQTPDLTDAEGFGTDGTIQWAFYSDGILRVGGSGSMRYYGSPDSTPWAEYMDRITGVEILYGIENIGEYAFAELPVLESVIIADSVTSVNDYAFMGSGNLRNVIMSSATQFIGYSAFAYCSSIMNIQIPYGVRQIDSRAFMGCTSLEQISLPSSITGYKVGKNVEVVEGLGTEVFSGCTSLRYVEMPIAVRHVPDRFFYNCTSLEEVILPVNVEYIGEKAFSKCVSLERITIMSNLTELRRGAFSYCTSLKEIYIFATYYMVKDSLLSNGSPEDKYPFGDPANITVYGVAETSTEYLAKNYGYAFVDILSLVN